MLRCSFEPVLEVCPTTMSSSTNCALSKRDRNFVHEEQRRQLQDLHATVLPSWVNLPRVQPAHEQKVQVYKAIPQQGSWPRKKGCVVGLEGDAKEAVSIWARATHNTILPPSQRTESDGGAPAKDRNTRTGHECLYTQYSMHP